MRCVRECLGRSLNISPLFFDGVVGLEEAESDRLFTTLMDFTLQDRFIYWHEWQPSDLVIWNNDRTLHSAAGHEQKYKRLMNRITLFGDRELGRAEAAWLIARMPENNTEDRLASPRACRRRRG